jgi:hypothetical protein
VLAYQSWEGGSGGPIYIIEFKKVASFFITSAITSFLNSTNVGALSPQVLSTHVALGGHRGPDRTAVAARIATTMTLVLTDGECVYSVGALGVRSIQLRASLSHHSGTATSLAINTIVPMAPCHRSLFVSSRTVAFGELRIIQLIYPTRQYQTTSAFKDIAHWHERSETETPKNKA